MKKSEGYKTKTSSLASYIFLFIQCQQCNVASDDTSSHLLTALWGCGRDVSIGIVANAGDYKARALARETARQAGFPAK